MLNFLFVFLLLTSLQIVAATKQSGWSSKWGLEWINGILVREVAESDLNPDNRVFNIPRGFARADIRGDFKFKYYNDLSLIFRPRFLGTSSDIFYPQSKKPLNKSEAKWDMNEAYLDYDVTDFLSLSLGLQNFQWGPAESLSPSNAIFHFENDQKSVFYRAKGKVLARSNITIYGNHSLILIHEPETNREPYWIADKKFEKKSLAKWESRNRTDSNTYMGITYGSEDQERKFIGGYFNIFYQETYSFYTDIKKSDGSIAYYPKESTPGQFVFQTDSERLEKDQYLAVVGFRKEARGDFRLEWIYNSAGYDKIEIGNIGKALKNDQINYLTNLALASKPGLEMYTQNYLYLSYRLPDLGKKKLSTLFFRYLHSLQDESGNFEMNWESPVNNFWNYYIEATMTNGQLNSEFRLLEKASFFVGAKMSL